MLLLDPRQTQSGKDRSEAERKDRIRKLNDEESVIARRVNQARENELKEKAVIEADLASFRVKIQEEKKELEKTVVPLRSEVKDLEERKRVALEPIDQAREAVEKREKEVSAREATVAENEVKVAEGQRTLVERTTALVEREEANVERTAELDRREAKVKAEEEASRLSANQLANKWVAYHETVAETNADLARREKIVEDGKKTNESFAITLRTEAGDLAEGRRQLRDGYRALEQAKIHLGIK